MKLAQVALLTCLWCPHLHADQYDSANPLNFLRAVADTARSGVSAAQSVRRRIEASSNNTAQTIEAIEAPAGSGLDPLVPGKSNTTRAGEYRVLSAQARNRAIAGNQYVSALQRSLQLVPAGSAQANVIKSFISDQQRLIKEHIQFANYYSGMDAYLSGSRSSRPTNNPNAIPPASAPSPQLSSPPDLSGGYSTSDDGRITPIGSDSPIDGWMMNAAGQLIRAATSSVPSPSVPHTHTHP